MHIKSICKARIQNLFTQTLLLRLIAAILPEAKRALNTAVKFEGKMSVDSGKVDACVPNSIVWGLSLEGVSIFGSKCLSSCKCCISNLARLPSSSSKKKEVVTYSSVHNSSAAAPTGASSIGGVNKKKNTGHRDSTTFTYVNTQDASGSKRVCLDLCISCIETNRLMRKIATETGQKYENEPCDLCKERASRLATLNGPSSYSSIKSATVSPSKRALAEHRCG